MTTTDKDMEANQTPAKLPAKYAGATPGPWVFHRGAGHAYNRIEGSDIIHTNGRDYGNGMGSCSYTERVCENLGDTELPGPQANALLISDAPRLAASVVELREAISELRDLVQGIMDGDYTPDSFTLQPADNALGNSSEWTV